MFEIQTMCSMCVCVGGGVYLPLQIKSIPSLVSHLKWVNYLRLSQCLLSQKLSQQGQTNTSTFLYLQIHSRCIPNVPGVFAYQPGYTLANYFPTTNMSPGAVGAFAFEILKYFVLLWLKSDVYLWIVPLGKTDEKNRNLRPPLTILCQNEETLSPRWNKFHGFKRLSEGGFIFQQSLNSRRQPLQDQPDRWSAGKTESWLFQSLIPPRLSFLNWWLVNRLLIRDHPGVGLPSQVLECLNVMLWSEIMRLRGTQSIFPARCNISQEPLKCHTETPNNTSS